MRDAFSDICRSTFPRQVLLSSTTTSRRFFKSNPQATSKMAATVLGKRQRTAVDLEGNYLSAAPKRFTNFFRISTSSLRQQAPSTNSSNSRGRQQQQPVFPSS